MNGYPTDQKSRSWMNRRSDPGFTTVQRGEIDAGAQRLVDEARALRLSDLRRRQRATQVKAADAVGTTRGRVWRIEKDQLKRRELQALAAYVQEHGGTLKIAATSGDETYV
jgi:hypothetical protein